MTARDTRNGLGTEQAPQRHLTTWERLAERWPILSPFVVKWCHERQWATDWAGGECRFRLNHKGSHENFAGRNWS